MSWVGQDHQYVANFTSIHHVFVWFWPTPVVRDAHSMKWCEKEGGANGEGGAVRNEGSVLVVGCVCVCVCVCERESACSITTSCLRGWHGGPAAGDDADG
jgi:hypothetical protein